MKKISIIITGRDDNYGDDQNLGIYNLNFKPKTFIDRIKYSIENNLKIFEKIFKENFEYIVVDWSPIENNYLKDNIGLKELLSHKNIKNSIVDPSVVSSIGLNPLSFYEYFAKNVGIRNSKGEFILITNSDDYFDENLVSEIYSILEKGDKNFYYRPKYRKDVNDIFEVIGEGPSFYEGSEFGKIGTPASGDFTLSHRYNIIDLGKGYNEETSISNDQNLRQTSLDGALLINMYLKGVNPYCLENSIFSFHHNKIERFNNFEILEKYENREGWGLDSFTPEKIDKILYYR
jgi:hypothetical protein